MLCGLKNVNSGNWFLVQYILTSWWSTSSLFLDHTLCLYTFYYLTFMCFPWSKRSYLHDALDKFFWNSFFINSHQHYVLMCEFPFLYQTFHLQAVAKGPLSGRWTFLCIINAVYNLYVMAWCTYPTINKYIKCLQKYG